MPIDKVVFRLGLHSFIYSVSSLTLLNFVETDCTYGMLRDKTNVNELYNKPYGK